MKDMHPHMVKAVHAQFPSLLAHMLPLIQHVLPKKVAERIKVYGSVKDMYKTLEASLTEDDPVDKLTAAEWAQQRQERYNETLAKLSLD